MVYLESPRVRLRQYEDRDFDRMCKLNSDPEVMRYLGGKPESREDVERGVARTKFYREKFAGRLGVFTAELREHDEFIGWFLLRPDRQRVEDVKNLEIGYRLMRKYWGQGYATEVSLLLRDKAFAELGAETLFAQAHIENGGSRRVIEKIGLRFEKEVLDPDWKMPVAFYTLSKTDWRKCVHGR